MSLAVAFLSLASVEGALDDDFGTSVRWDVPLLDGYNWVHPPNRSLRPNVHRFFGLVNPGLWQEVRRGHFDVVVLHGYRAASFWIAWAAARASGARVAWTTDATTLEPRDRRTWKTAVKCRVLPWLFRSAHAVFVPSSRGRRFLLSIGVPADRVHLTPYAVDNGFFASRALAADRAETRRSWGLPSDAFVALFVGKLASWKRPGDLLRAAASLDGVWVVLAGDGALRDNLMHLARDLGISERVRFLGFVNQTELPEIYGAADVLVLPSEFEPFGLVVNESFASGTPALVSAACGAADDLIVEGETGFTFPVGDVGALADLLRRTQDRDVRTRLAAGARDRIHEWGPAANLEASISVLQQLASRSSTHAAR